MNAKTSNLEISQQKHVALTGGLHLRVFDKPEVTKDIWKSLEISGAGTLYQSYAWCKTWVEQFAESRNITPCIVIAENGFGIVEFLLPLQIRRAGGVTIIEMLTAPQCGYASPLYNLNFLKQRAAQWFTDNLDHLTAALPDHDVFHLHDMPSFIQTYKNPMLQKHHFRGANQSHVLDLQQSFEELYVRRRSHESRRSIRKRDAKLEALQNLRFELTTENYIQLETVETMFKQQEHRLGQFGITNIFDSAERKFYAALVTSDPCKTTVFRTYRLTLDGRILAVLLGAHSQGVFWALISSMDDAYFKKYSPGDYILRQIIKSLCVEGVSALDFSAGDTAYKHHWSDRQIQLNFTVSTRNLKGLPLAARIFLKEQLKRFVKQTPTLKFALFKARKLLLGKRASS